VSGAPYSYTVGAGDRLSARLPNPGTYDLSLHGINGFYRHFAGSPATTVSVTPDLDHKNGKLTLKVSTPGKNKAVTVKIADAYGGTQRLKVAGTDKLTVQTQGNGGWYDLTLTSPDDPSFTYALAGRLESAKELTSDPQLGGAA
jgi:phospholipase C